MEPPTLTIETAKQYLITGLHPHWPTLQLVNPMTGQLGPADRRMLPGEKIIIYKLDDLGRVEGYLEVHSSSYAWRSSILDHDPNLYHRFVNLSNFALQGKRSEAEHYAEYVSKFPILFPIDDNAMRSSLLATPPQLIISWSGFSQIQYPGASHPTTFLISGTPQNVATPLMKLKNILYCFLTCVPLHVQAEVFEFYGKFIQDRKDLVNWIINVIKPMIETNNELFLTHRFKKHVHTRLENLIKLANTSVSYSRKTGAAESSEFLFKKSIENLIGKEKGHSLYRLFASMKNFKAGKTLPKPVESAPTATAVTNEQVTPVVKPGVPLSLSLPAEAAPSSSVPQATGLTFAQVVSSSNTQSPLTLNLPGARTVPVETIFS